MISCLCVGGSHIDMCCVVLGIHACFCEGHQFYSAFGSDCKQLGHMLQQLDTMKHKINLILVYMSCVMFDVSCVIVCDVSCHHVTCISPLVRWMNLVVPRPLMMVWD